MGRRTPVACAHISPLWSWSGYRQPHPRYTALVQRYTVHMRDAQNMLASVATRRLTLRAGGMRPRNVQRRSALRSVGFAGARAQCAPRGDASTCDASTCDMSTGDAATGDAATGDGEAGRWCGACGNERCGGSRVMRSHRRDVWRRWLAAACRRLSSRTLAVSRGRRYRTPAPRGRPGSARRSLLIWRRLRFRLEPSHRLRPLDRRAHRRLGGLQERRVSYRLGAVGHGRVREWRIRRTRQRAAPGPGG